MGLANSLSHTFRETSRLRGIIWQKSLGPECSNLSSRLFNGLDTLPSVSLFVKQCCHQDLPSLHRRAVIGIK